MFALIFFFLIFVLCSFFLLNKEILAPSLMFSLGYLLAILCCAVNIDEWDVEINIITIVLLLIGAAVFLMFDFSFATFTCGRNDLSKNKIIQNEQMNVPLGKNYIIIVTSLLIFFIYFGETVKMVNGAGVSNVSNTISYVRAILVGNISSNYHISPIITQLYKCVVASAYIYLYVLMNNLVAVGIKITLRKYWSYFIVPAIAATGNMLLQGGRLTIIRLIIATFVFYILIKSYAVGRMYQLDTRMFLKIVVGILAIGILFWLSTNILGRGIGYSPVEYVTNYFGGGIELFDEYLQERHSRSGVFGEETFYDVIDFLRKIGIIEYEGIERLEFRQLGNSVNNVYTGYRRLIEDFGIAGMLFLHILMCMIYSFFYYCVVRTKIETRSNKYKRSFLMYGYIFFCIVVHPFDNYFFALISLNNIGIIAFMWIIWEFIFNVSFVNSKIIICKS